jgi:hypothetical protein
MIDPEFEAMVTKALEDGDACFHCLRKADGQRAFNHSVGRSSIQHARTCKFRMKHGCPQCGTKEGRHLEGCTWEITDEQQADHDAWERIK